MLGLLHDRTNTSKIDLAYVIVRPLSTKAVTRIYFRGVLVDDTACMAEARRAEEWVGFLGRTRRAPSPPARGLRERCKLPQWGPGRSPGRNRFWCISKLVEGIKTVFTTKRDTVG